MVKKAKKEKEADEGATAMEANKYEHPNLTLSRVDNRSVEAHVKLAAPVCLMLEFDLQVTPSTTIGQISDKIIERHGGSIKDLSVCVNRYHPEEIVPSSKTLEACGVSGGECTVYYDFLAVGGPLLQ